MNNNIFILNQISRFILEDDKMVVYVSKHFSLQNIVHKLDIMFNNDKSKFINVCNRLIYVQIEKDFDDIVDILENYLSMDVVFVFDKDGLNIEEINSHFSDKMHIL